ncbi:MAG: hypothetical protein ACRDOB_00515 [Streptosporangiaceae bacterium]
MTNRTRAELATVFLAALLASACNGKSSSAKEAVAVASKKLYTICPGAAS